MHVSGGTIADALAAIEKRDYVLPAIQREFVWGPDQIERLFDSLMQGYPFGTFLFWKVEPATAAKFRFYDFMLNFHERDAWHCQPAGKLPNHPVTAVLDGQQRLTALNIGLRGSMSLKQRNKRWASNDAFPKRSLYLNLTAPRDPDEDGALYRFKFLTDEQAIGSDGSCWFAVGRILGLTNGTDLHEAIEAYDLDKEQRRLAFSAADRLREVVHTKPSINLYEEKAQDIERVLNIFIRLNSSGTVLSYSDLLLSIAVAQWDNVDAREAVNTLVADLNATGRQGFNFSKDFVLKAGLMLADIASVGFKVENFTVANMGKLEAGWSQIERALKQTVALIDSFGLSGQTLRADSALLPIAYYLHRRQVADNYVTHSAYAKDREAIRRWLVRSLLKTSGIWGSGLDVLLTALREQIKTHGECAFPVEALRQEMDKRGKTLRFEDAEIDDLLHLPYGDKRTLPLLSLLFPFIDLRHDMHVDHIFPISRFTLRRLVKAGFDGEAAERMIERGNELPNLQLLEGEANKEKQAAMPAVWLTKRWPDLASRTDFCDRHLLNNVPEDLTGFEAFFKKRRKQMEARLADLLGSGD